MLPSLPRKPSNQKTPLYAVASRPRPDSERPAPIASASGEPAARPPVSSTSSGPESVALSESVCARAIADWPFTVRAERLLALSPSRLALLDAVVTAFVSEASAPGRWLEREGFGASPSPALDTEAQAVLARTRNRCGNLMLLATRLGNFVNLQSKVGLPYRQLRAWAYQKRDPVGGEVGAPSDEQCAQIEQRLALPPGWLDEPYASHFGKEPYLHVNQRASDETDSHEP